MLKRVSFALFLAAFVAGCHKGAPGPRHRERAQAQDANCREPAQPKAFFYPAENRVDYGPDDPKQDGCALLVPDHLFCCPDLKRATDR
jgi:PBP1b-binding outer membrane lipoprotein LpoB